MLSLYFKEFSLCTVIIYMFFWFNLILYIYHHLQRLFQSSQSITNTWNILYHNFFKYLPSIAIFPSNTRRESIVQILFMYYTVSHRQLIKSKNSLSYLSYAEHPTLLNPNKHFNYTIEVLCTLIFVKIRPRERNSLIK